MQYILNQEEYDALMRNRARLIDAISDWIATGIEPIIDHKSKEARLPGLTLIHSDSRKALYDFFMKLGYKKGGQDESSSVHI